MLRPSNWTWLVGGWGNMADLAERVDDLICSFDTSAGATMDTLSMLIFGWMLLGLIILCVGKFIYNKFHHQQQQQQQTKHQPHTAGAAVGSHHLQHQQHSQTGIKDGLHTAVAGLHAIGENVVLLGAGVSASGVAAAVARSRSVNASRNASSGPLSGGTLSPASSTTFMMGSGSGSGYVPPTPPVRKRLTRKNSGPLVSQVKSTRNLQLPAATGPDPEAVRWTNEMIYWLHTDLVVLDEILAVWVNSLNDFVASTINEHSLGVEFIRVLPETYPPALSNIFCECDSKDDVTITCDCEATPALQLKAFRQHGDKVETSNYRVNVNRLRARLNVVCITEKLLVDLKCDGWPEVKVLLAPVGTIKKDLDETHLQELLTEIVVGAIRGTNLHLNLSCYTNCPRLWREPVQTGYTLPIHYDSMSGSNKAIKRRSQAHGSSTTLPQYPPGDRRLLVKVVRAADISGQSDCKEIYCVVELDDPPQRHQTSIKKDTKSPVWDEAFLFDISQNTTEVLLEIFDRANKSERFLGLGIVGVEELLANPSQRQIIPLQGRPYQDDEITGTLTVEFLFIEGAEVPQIGSKPFKVKETIKQPSSPIRAFNPTNNLLSNNSLNYNNGNSTLILYDSTNESGGDFLKNGSSLNTPSRTGHSNGNKGTLIVHSQQRQADREVVKVALSEYGEWQEVSSEPGDSDRRATPGQDSTANSSNSDSLKERGRTRRKRRDFFGTIRKRLSRSKTRSRSAGPEGDPNYEDAHSRSISADRGKDTNRDEHSRRSSISEASAISGTSIKTYVNEASTLVLETVENGIRKHYLVPLAMAQKSKWKKKGTKLHIFNDHTFIAKHMSSGTVCEVCKKTLARRLGKQGYECRDCHMKCHKHCHVKVDSMCSKSTIQNIELTYVISPKLKRKPSMRIR